MSMKTTLLDPFVIERAGRAIYQSGVLSSSPKRKWEDLSRQARAVFRAAAVEALNVVAEDLAELERIRGEDDR